jgi:cytochrome c biogenesis protein CcdA
MLRLIGLVVSIGLADSLNPTTIAPALYIATGERAAVRVAEFTFGVFAVYFIGGAAIALGPGQLILSLVPSPGPDTRHILEIIAGATLIAAAAVLWFKRRSLASRRMPQVAGTRRSSAILGATITAVELPTAFPYFAAIAAIVGSGFGPWRQLFLLTLFNVCFILPLVAIVATLAFAGDRAEQIIATGRSFLERHWPIVLSGLLLVAGLFVLLLGITGITARNRGDVGEFSRGLRRVLHP